MPHIVNWYNFCGRAQNKIIVFNIPTISISELQLIKIIKNKKLPPTVRYNVIHTLYYLLTTTVDKDNVSAYMQNKIARKALGVGRKQTCSIKDVANIVDTMLDSITTENMT